MRRLWRIIGCLPYETSIAIAREEGVIALFGEKYGDIVRVHDIEGFSRELCGGTHVGATGEIGFVKIIAETSVGANLRRIEAMTSFDALEYMNRMQTELTQAAEALHVSPFEVGERTLLNLSALKEMKNKTRQSRTSEVENVIEKMLDKRHRQRIFPSDR